MAKFVYKMQNILELKVRLESQAKTEYAQKAAELNAEEEKMQRLILKGREYENRIREYSEFKIDIVNVRKYSEYFEIIKENIKEQALKITIAQRNLERARQKLNVTIQERKIQDKLKEKAFEEFKIELNEQEKKEIDELVSFKYNDKKTGD